MISSLLFPRVATDKHTSTVTKHNYADLQTKEDEARPKEEEDE